MPIVNTADVNTVERVGDVLIVEDDRMLNIVMTIQIEVAGYTVRSATTGLQALNMIMERLPIVLILDIGLPDMTGIELSAELRKNKLSCSLPLIVHTTLELSAEEKELLKLGPTRFVTKTTAFSFQMKELIEEVTRPNLLPDGKTKN